MFYFRKSLLNCFRLHCFFVVFCFVCLCVFSAVHFMFRISRIQTIVLQISRLQLENNTALSLNEETHSADPCDSQCKAVPCFTGNLPAKNLDFMVFPCENKWSRESTPCKKNVAGKLPCKNSI